MALPVSPPPRRAPLGLVLRPEPARDPAPEIDWSRWYLTDEDDMGEGVEQGEIIRSLLSALQVEANTQRWEGRLVGSDQFFAWVEREPMVRVSPDVYILENPPLRPSPRHGRPGKAPPSSLGARGGVG